MERFLRAAHIVNKMRVLKELFPHKCIFIFMTFQYPFIILTVGGLLKIWKLNMKK